MAANANDYFQHVGEPGTATTLSAPGYTEGATTINVGSTTNFADDTGVIFAIDETETDDNGDEVRVQGTYNVYEGTVASGTGINNVSWLRGDGDRNYSAGASTRVYVTTSSAWADRLVDGMLVSHNQDGTLGANVVDTQAIDDDAITTAKIDDEAVTAEKTNFATFTLAAINDAGGSLGAYSTTWVTATGLTAAVTIPAGVTKVRITANGSGINVNTATGAYIYARIIDETDTVIMTQEVRQPATAAHVAPFHISGFATVTPGASKTYRIQISLSAAGTGSLYVNRQIEVVAIG